MLQLKTSVHLQLHTPLTPCTMAEPPPSTPNPIPPSGSAPPPAPSTSTPPQQPPAAPTLKPREPLTGFRASLEHTGVPRSVLTWKPRLPSRNWTIFLTVVGTITYLYYDDRRQCKAIREQYLDRVRYRGLEPTGSSLELPRKVKVIGAKWPEDDDDDRALRYFRKYVKVSAQRSGALLQTIIPFSAFISLALKSEIYACSGGVLTSRPSPTS